MKFFTYILFTLTTLALLTACEGKMQKMANQELAEKQAECVRSNPTSPGRVTACENIREECEARRKKGNYTC